MRGHLTPEQFSDGVAGVLNPDAQRHLSTCTDCRAEIERMQGVLSAFRSSVQEWGHREMPVARPLLPAGSNAWFTQFRAVAAVAMIAIALLAGLMLRRTETVKGRQPSISDAALLEQIDTQISRKVPTHLEPLLDLVAQDSSNGGS